jgi:hypothetical protein
MGMFSLSLGQYGPTAARSWYREPKPQTPEPVKSAVDDWAWQMFRGCRLKGTTTAGKLSLLAAWLNCWQGTPYERLATTQVINYLGALKRGGFIKDEYDRRLDGREFFNVCWSVIK